MRVVFLLTQDRGGPVDLTVALASELARLPDGPQITIVGPDPVCSAGSPDGLLRRLHIRSKTDLRGMSSVRRLLTELRPDIVHAQDRRATLAASLLAPGRVPVVATFHGVPDRAAGRWVADGPLHARPAGIYGTSRLIADSLVAHRVTRTVTPSAAMADFLRTELHVPRRRITVVPNGVRIPVSARPAPAAGVRTFATAGSFAPCKAAPLLVRAFLAVAAQRQELRLLLIGDGEDRAACEQMVRQHGAAHQVEFTGYRTDVAAQLRRADAFVLPSVNENLPLALLEAMATGLPCIASAVGGIPELLTPECGILIRPGDEQALRSAITRLADDSQDAARLGLAARHRVQQRFSLARCAAAHHELWCDVLSARSADRQRPRQ